LRTKVALAHLADSRTDFFSKREPLALEELQALAWLRQAFEVVESDIMRSSQEVFEFAQQVAASGAQSLIVHLPIWADPIFTLKLKNYISLPILLLGNSRPETSSIVGLLGAGGALDEVGQAHVRVFDHTSPEARKPVKAFVRAAAARSRLRGQVLGLFGGRSLGIFTAVADPAQWQQLFGVDIETIDQAEIIEVGQALPAEEVQSHTRWLLERLGGVEYGGIFNENGLERQIRSYIATSRLIKKYDLDFVGVKCQPELSDGYASQCVSHMLLNGALDLDGEKQTVVHACESDANGALTMQILHLLSEGQPAALLDIRWFNSQTGTWTLANCGAIPAAFAATIDDQSGLSGVRLIPHVFGQGGGGALPAIATPQPVTLARLCRKKGEYWMAVVAGDVERYDPAELGRTTAAFPQALVKSSAGTDFLARFGSNHIHMVAGDFSQELVAFCKLTGLRWELWETDS
jgi:L-fucose isomerase